TPSETSTLDPSSSPNVAAQARPTLPALPGVQQKTPTLSWHSRHQKREPETQHDAIICCSIRISNAAGRSAPPIPIPPREKARHAPTRRHDTTLRSSHSQAAAAPATRLAGGERDEEGGRGLALRLLRRLPV
uniref:Uncharacterized protein n=1 Tax=Aegilops tauschii subsp. strangulata TaxID=200361 RepID=A0A453LU09_AEGTS